MPKDTIAPAVEEELTTLTSQTSRSPSKSLLYKCTPSRAKYLARWFDWLQIRSALDSTKMLPPNDPIYGKGVHWFFHMKPTTDGLIIRQFPPDSIQDLSPGQIALLVAYGDNDLMLAFQDLSARDAVATRIQRKLYQLSALGEYPQIAHVRLAKLENPPRLHVIKEGIETAIHAILLREA